MTDAELKERLDLSIAELGVSPHTATVLEKHGILFVSHLLKYTEPALKRLRGVGEKKMIEIFKRLESIGFRRTGVLI